MPVESRDETRTVHDPILDKEVQVSDRLTDRLRGRYACGPTMADGEPEFGWREFETPPIQHEAATRIESAAKRIAELEQLLSDIEALKNAYRADCQTAERALAEERERCAQIAEDYDEGRLVYTAAGCTIESTHGERIATAIRSGKPDGKE